MLCERSESVRDLADLRQGHALVSLVDILWPAAACSKKVQVSKAEHLDSRSTVLARHARLMTRTKPVKRLIKCRRLQSIGFSLRA